MKITDTSKRLEVTELSAGKIKKNQRAKNKVDLRKYYTLVQRVPLEGKKLAYTKLMSTYKANQLINGKMDMMGQIIFGSREFNEVKYTTNNTINNL